MPVQFTVHAIRGLPMVAPGDDLAAAILAAIEAQKLSLEPGDILVIAQKIVSKAEGRYVRLDSVTPTQEALEIADVTGKDPRLVEIILRESTQVVRMKPGVLIVRHKQGWVCAQAGVDQSNIDHRGGEQALLLPEDADASARNLVEAIHSLRRVRVGIIICDSMNRPWRLGSVGVAIGVAGVRALEDHRGGEDLYGRELQVTLIGRADAIASAANLAMGETTARIPLALVRGMDPKGDDSIARDLIRPMDEDMFL